MLESRFGVRIQNFDFVENFTNGSPIFLVYNDLAEDFFVQLNHIFVDFHQIIAVVAVVAVVTVVAVVAGVAVVAVFFLFRTPP